MVLALAFLLTVAIEWVVLAWFSKLGFARTGWFCLCLNAASWGAAMGVLALWPIPVPVMEGSIILVEAVLLRWYWDWRMPRALGGSFLMNIASWGIGYPVVLFIARRL